MALPNQHEVQGLKREANELAFALSEARSVARDLAEALREARVAIGREGSGSARRALLPKIDAALVRFRETQGEDG